MSPSLSKNIFSVFQNALIEFITCVVYMYVCEHCINDFLANGTFVIAIGRDHVIA